MRGREEPLHATNSGTEVSERQKEVAKKWGGKDMKREMIKREEGERARTCLSQTIAATNSSMRVSSRQEKWSCACCSEVVISEDVYTERTSKIEYSSSVHKSGERS
jgi:hypothetical protein